VFIFRLRVCLRHKVHITLVRRTQGYTEIPVRRASHRLGVSWRTKLLVKRTNTETTHQ